MGNLKIKKIKKKSFLLDGKGESWKYLSVLLFFLFEFKTLSHLNQERERAQWKMWGYEQNRLEEDNEEGCKTVNSGIKRKINMEFRLRSEYAKQKCMTVHTRQ